jgi:hypothetical protein
MVWFDTVNVSSDGLSIRCRLDDCLNSVISEVVKLIVFRINNSEKYSIVTDPDSFTTVERYFLSENGMRNNVPATNKAPVSAISLLKVEQAAHMIIAVNSGCPKVMIEIFIFVEVLKLSTNANRSVPTVG